MSQKQLIASSIGLIVTLLLAACGSGQQSISTPTPTRFVIHFTNSGCDVNFSSDQSYAIAYVSISWGDSSFYSEMHPALSSLSHRYSHDGTYTISFTYALYDGDVHTYYETVTIVNCNPIAASTKMSTQITSLIITETPVPIPAETPLPTSVPDCQSATPRQEQMVLFSGMDAPAYLYLYTEPSLGAPLTNGQPYGPFSYDVEPGTPLFVRDGPVCAEGLVWWKVQNYFNASVQGWTPEANNGITFLFLCEGQIGCMSQIGEAGPPDGGYNP